MQRDDEAVGAGEVRHAQRALRQAEDAGAGAARAPQVEGLDTAVPAVRHDDVVAGPRQADVIQQRGVGLALHPGVEGVQQAGRHRLDRLHFLGEVKVAHGLAQLGQVHVRGDLRCAQEIRVVRLCEKAPPLTVPEGTDAVSCVEYNLTVRLLSIHVFGILMEIRRVRISR